MCWPRDAPSQHTAACGSRCPRWPPRSAPCDRTRPLPAPPTDWACCCWKGVMLLPQRRLSATEDPLGTREGPATNNCPSARYRRGMEPAGSSAAQFGGWGALGEAAALRRRWRGGRNGSVCCRARQLLHTHRSGPTQPPVRLLRHGSPAPGRLRRRDKDRDGASRRMQAVGRPPQHRMGCGD